MTEDWKPWPLSELDAEERRRIIALPLKERKKRVEQLKRDILSGELARRKRLREMDAR